MSEVQNCNSIKLNFYLYARKLNSPKANHKLRRSKEKETKHTQTKPCVLLE
jgi:hypothetical protein